MLFRSDWEHRETQVTSDLIRKGIEEHKINAKLRAEIERLKQRTWVGLTDEEITELHHEIKVRLMGTYKTEDIYRAIEAKLRSKNNG